MKAIILALAIPYLLWPVLWICSALKLKSYEKETHRLGRSARAGPSRFRINANRNGSLSLGLRGHSPIHN